MKTKYAAGPWYLHPKQKVVLRGASFHYRHDITGSKFAEPIASLYGNEQAEANARLISAAPDMLAALETALDDFREKECNCDADYVDGREVGYPCYFHRIEQMLREAIAKAEGK